MTREEASEYFARKRDTLIWGLKDNRDETRQAHDAYNEAINALCGPRPDPITGLVPCGCGGKVDVAFYPGWHGVPDKYQVDCFYCHVGTRPCQTAEQAKAAWNTAMGCTGR